MAKKQVYITKSTGLSKQTVRSTIRNKATAEKRDYARWKNSAFE